MRTIKKAKLNGVGYLELEYIEDVTNEAGEKFTVECSKKCTWDVHPDFLNILDELKPHLAVLCEQVEHMLSIMAWDNATEKGHPILSKLKVTGFVIGGADEHEGVTLIGRRMLANNRVLNLISPFTKWEDEHNGYEYGYELANIINRLQIESDLYLDGKMRPSAQLSLFEPENKVS